MNFVERASAEAATGRAKISDAEVERRRKIVRQADANNRLEGLFREPETEAVVAAYIRGEIEAEDILSLFATNPAPI